MIATVGSIIEAAQSSIQEEIQIVRQLEVLASQHPYYKFNYAWTRQMQDVVCLPLIVDLRSLLLM